MEAIREITVWEGMKRQPNHTYLMDGDKAVAYKVWHTGEPFYFKTPSRLDKRYRKFVPADVALFQAPAAAAENALIEVQGSKGATYWVDPKAKTCTCPGFTFRGDCKHIKELA